MLSLNRSLRTQSLKEPPPLAEKITEEPITSKTAQSTATSVYMANISNQWRKVTVTWCKNLMNHSLNITVHSIDGEINYTCKIDLKPWHFWSKKGYKAFDVDDNGSSHLEVFWDVRSAKFTNNLQPQSDFYVALVCDEEIVLLIGDYKKKAYKRTKSRPCLVDAVLFYKKETVFAKKCFSIRAKLDEKRKENDIVVESSTTGPKDPEMWISIDGIVLIHVCNLQWKFRGNQTVLVNKQPVQVFWDVHDWLFNSTGNGRGLFIFKPGPAESESDIEGSTHDDDGTTYYPTRSTNGHHEFCLFLHAWKIE